MCKEFNLRLLAKIPIELSVGIATESGKCIYKEYKDSETSKELEKIVNEILSLSK